MLRLSSALECIDIKAGLISRNFSKQSSSQTSNPNFKAHLPLLFLSLKWILSPPFQSHSSPSRKRPRFRSANRTTARADFAWSLPGMLMCSPPQTRVVAEAADSASLHERFWSPNVCLLEMVHASTFSHTVVTAMPHHMCFALSLSTFAIGYMGCRGLRVLVFGSD